MKGFKKFLLVLYLLVTGLFFLAAALFGVAQITGMVVIPRVEKLDYYFTLPSLYVVGAGLLVFAVYGLGLIGATKRKRGVPVVRKITADGDINITVDAVKTVVEFAVREFANLQMESVGVMVKDNNVDIAVRVFALDINRLAETTASMQDRVKEVVEDNLGIIVNSIRVLVNDVKGDKPLAKALPYTQEAVGGNTGSEVMAFQQTEVRD